MQTVRINDSKHYKNSLVKSPALPSFRGREICALNSDTVEIDNKKNKKLKSVLGLLFLGTVIVSSIKLFNFGKINNIFKSEFKDIKQIQRYFSEIFEKDISKKEAKKLAKKYKKICRIKDDNQYLQELFEQLKNDYGFGNSHIKLEIQDFTSANAPNWQAIHADTGHMVTISRVDNKLADRKTLFDTLFHELKHHKQFEIAVATDKAAYENAVAYKKIKEYTTEQIEKNGGTQAVIDWLIEQGRLYMKPEVDRIEKEIGQLPKDSPLYKRGLEYIKARLNYIHQQEDIISKNSDFKNNILEREANLVGDIARKLFDLIK